MSHITPTFIVHGGAWDIPDDEVPGHLNGCRIAAQIGWSILQQGGSALDAVEAAIRSLEDDPAFDAGRGAWLNSAGEVELDAIIMDGATLKNGAVAAVQHVRNPISLARLVMEKTPHALIAGPGAEHFAQAQGMPLCDESELLTGHELERWQPHSGAERFHGREGLWRHAAWHGGRGGARYRTVTSRRAHRRAAHPISCRAAWATVR